MKIKIFTLIIIFPLVTICCSKDDTQNKNCDHLIDEPYDFPLKPGVPEWGDLETEEERINAVQVPESLLKCLTDEALLQTCIDFPLYLYLTASSNPDPSIGFGELVDKFNGLQELYGRKYIERVLLSRYVAEDIYSFVERYNVFRLYYFNLFFSKESIISELKEDQVDIFIKKSLEYYDAIQGESPPYVICCNVVELAIVYLEARVMLYHNFPPFVDYYESNDFINESFVPHDSITKYARQFIIQ